MRYYQCEKSHIVPNCSSSTSSSLTAFVTFQEQHSHPNPFITINIQQGTSMSLLRLAAPTVIQESLDAFLARFDEDGTNEHTASHFCIFSGANADWLRFSVPSDSIPLLERLLAKYEDFITRFKLGAGIGNFLLRLLAAIVMDMHNTHLDLLREKKLF